MKYLLYFISLIYARGNYLTHLANYYHSDKGNLWPNKHNYTKHYHIYFSKIKNKKDVKILEIGLCRGLDEGWKQEDAPSIKMWLKYFRYAMIYGYDCSDFSFFTHNRFRFYQGNQGKRKDLEKFIKQNGKDFDIIIDDGSHTSHDQQISLGFLFHYLKNGGYYVIEDMNWQPPELEKKNSIKTKDLLISYQKDKIFDSQYLTYDENDYLSSNIEQCNIFGNDTEVAKMSILEKR